MSFLIDTDVISEISKPNPDENVRLWFEKNRGQYYLCTVTVAELRRGIERLPASHRKTHLSEWFVELCKSMDGRILSFNISVAHVWGQQMALWQNSGKSVSTLDSMIAATAIRHRLTLVTRNSVHFENLAIRLIDPFATQNIDGK